VLKFGFPPLLNLDPVYGRGGGGEYAPTERRFSLNGPCGMTSHITSRFKHIIINNMNATYTDGKLSWEALRTGGTSPTTLSSVALVSDRLDRYQATHNNTDSALGATGTT
jgi:hypothetical protein